VPTALTFHDEDDSIPFGLPAQFVRRKRSLNEVPPGESTRQASKLPNGHPPNCSGHLIFKDGARFTRETTPASPAANATSESETFDYSIDVGVDLGASVSTSCGAGAARGTGPWSAKRPRRTFAKRARPLLGRAVNL